MYHLQFFYIFLQYFYFLLELIYNHLLLFLHQFHLSFFGHKNLKYPHKNKFHIFQILPVTNLFLSNIVHHFFL